MTDYGAPEFRVDDVDTFREGDHPVGAQERLLASILVDLEYEPGVWVRPEDSVSDFARRLIAAGVSVPAEPPRFAPPKNAVEAMAQALLAEWERIEGPVTASYVANFADLARVALSGVPAEPGAPDLDAVPLDRLNDLDVEALYAAYETVMGDEAATIEGKRRIVEPLYRAASDIRLARLLALASQPVPAPERGPGDAKCVCGRSIFRAWVEGVEQPWRHWVEPRDHTAVPAQERSARLDAEIAAEVERARAKFGDQFDFTNGDWLAIITEEVGEAATECLRVKFFDPAGLLRRSNATGIPVEESDFPAARLRAEVVQVAAVARRWIAALDALAATPQDHEP